MNSEERQIYEAVCREAGFVDLSQRAKIDVTGPDRVSFLHSMISQDVAGLEIGQGRYSTFLTSTGKIIADFYVFRLEDRLMLDVEGDLAAGLKDALERFVIMDDVTLTIWDRPPAHFALYGPSSGAIIQQICSRHPPSRPLLLQEILLPSHGWFLSKPGLLPEGYEIILPNRPGACLAKEFAARGLQELPEVVIETLRIEAMIPRYGVDMSKDNNPLEAGLDDAYSLTKGCYVGQEVVAKATHVGGVNRLLAGLLLASDAEIPKAGMRLTKEGKRVGVITSACYSPRLDAPIALAYVRRGLARDQETLEIEAEGSSTSAQVFLEFPSPRSA